MSQVLLADRNKSTIVELNVVYPERKVSQSLFLNKAKGKLRNCQRLRLKNLMVIQQIGRHFKSPLMRLLTKIQICLAFKK